MRILCVLFFVLSLGSITMAQDAKPLPPIKPIERVLPPKGVTIAKEEREKLEARLLTVTKAIAAAKLDAQLKPDVEIYTKAVRWALDFDEFYDAKKDVAKAHAALDSAQKRLDELKSGKASWPTQRGLIARGYRSDIDDSVQPYGLHIPANLDLSKPVPLLVWLHGRGDKETDLHFIATREKSKGEFAPDWCITLHPYGRGTIGFKFAGEIDVLDAIKSVKQRYKIDEDRVALAGFSMGGAGVWHIGAHYADQFCVVHAGAGFVETAKYQKLTPEQYPEWYVQKLWGWYDVPDYTRNLFNVPVIAYSGEIDKQKQAADLMAEAFKAEGRELRHIVGPGAAHKYEAKAKEQVLKEIKAAVDKGRDRSPKEVHLQTRSLRYNRMHWAQVEQMKTHWEGTRIDAKVINKNRIEVKTQNVHAFELHRNDNWTLGEASYLIDGQQVIPPIGDQREIGTERFVMKDGKWVASRSIDYVSGKAKQHDMQGTIDDAFMEPFVMVPPSQRSSNVLVNRWVAFEFEHTRQRWRALFRGDPRIMEEAQLDTPEFRKYHLILWGSPESNRWMGMIIKGLGGQVTPIVWSQEQIVVGDQKFDAKNHVPVFIARNTFAPNKYVVINSGPTFREGHDRTNSQQTPKLPDWAVINIETDPDALFPGEIKAAGFFDENWKVKPQPENK